jgi:hypothetical protein
MKMKKDVEHSSKIAQIPGMLKDFLNQIWPRNFQE